ncbi:unnamed protein product [Musa acuminata subsp. burmannicoides]
MAEEGGGMRLAVTEIERLLNYTFRDPSLLEEALTHSSYAGHRSYERLEFVGDAVLGLAITSFFYLSDPTLEPGFLTELRIANASTEKLARVAVRHRLYRFLRRICRDLDQLVSKFTDLAMMEPEEDIVQMTYGGTTLEAPKVLADIVESIAAAVYFDCDSDLQLFWTVFRGILEPIITPEMMKEHPVMALYKLCQKHRKIVDISSSFDGSSNNFKVVVDGEVMGIGFSKQKNLARLHAARDALQRLSALQAADREEGDAGAEAEVGAKQKLNELCNKKHWMNPTYRIEQAQGPDHCKTFICSVQVKTEDKIFVISGDSKPKVRVAENSAAFKMLTEVLGDAIIPSCT